jgi:hypothetical protein
MKKIYMAPETEAIEIEIGGMLCNSPGSATSSDIGGDAFEPGKARFLDDWDEEE